MQSGGRRSLREDVFKTDPELGVTERSVLMWYRTGSSSRSCAQGKRSIISWDFEQMSGC